MANDLSVAVAAIIAAKGAPVLRENSIMSRYVNTDFSQDVGKQGDTIQVSVSGKKTATAVTPGPVPPAGSDTTLTTVPIALSNWFQTDFSLTSKQAAEIASSDTYITMEMEEAFRALANKVDTDVLSLYKKIGGYTGTAGTTPFATTTIDAANADLVLNTQNASQSGRAFIIDPYAKANAMQLAAFQYTQNAGDNITAKTGQIGHRLGFDFDMDQNMPLHTAGTITTGLIAKASTVAAVGATTITGTTAASTGACALLAGDIITIGTGTTARTYSVAANATQASAATDVTITLNQPLTVALAGSEAITVKASHRVNLAFTKPCLSLAVRPLAFDPKMMPAGTISTNYTDEVSGLPFRVDIVPGWESMNVFIKILYGYACTSPGSGTRIAG